MPLNSNKVSLALPALLLPAEFRRHLATPQGTLYVTPQRGDVFGLEATVSIGDVVSARHRTTIRVVDYKSMRRTRLNIAMEDSGKTRVIINSPGSLSLNAITIANATRTGYVRVLGEEDLLVIPYLAWRERISILYGQPGVGVVKLESSVNLALKILKILKPTVVTYRLGESCE
ncbi:MAG: DUF359 domain-containing protein [Desulfurococcaceae archaeon]|jgi:uncharacterized protein (UPF0218 family)|nr:DUF359 domain-containing protein [Desulfurococcaceae archaeon]